MGGHEGPGALCGGLYDAAPPVAGCVVCGRPAGVLWVGARLIARAHWRRRMGCRSESEAYGIIVSSLRRQVGAVAARAQARHRISRWREVPPSYIPRS